MNAAIAKTTPRAKETSMSYIRIVRDYPHPPAKVWRALTRRRGWSNGSTVT
jgi:hypothetical protein